MDIVSARRNLREQRAVVAGLVPRWREEALMLDTSWGPEEYAKVTRYLRERKPREQLDQMRTALAALRTALEEHFSIADVLLDVGNRRLGGERMA
ncbi:hypothetical protein B7P34_19355 [Streptosporangium nondiastaticum]|uniref:Uncharacterized protein n=2 Tax=Streptosporangium nondiastaticum TaxID=35764 RepID=A0A9X7PGL9_9ACTN|nr:hypothetical protein B7P34_19355 [Streptosporangium nondiastaticum]